MGEWVAGHSAGGKHGLETFGLNPRYRFVPNDTVAHITMCAFYII